MTEGPLQLIRYILNKHHEAIVEQLGEVVRSDDEPAIRKMRLALPCEYLHHEERDWHGHLEPCPMKARLREGVE